MSLRHKHEVGEKDAKRLAKTARAALELLVLAAFILYFAGSAHAAWQLVWSDEFTNAAIDPSKWVFETGNNNGWGNAEREYYTSRATNAFVSGGVLHIVARQESFGGFPYTSARMKTQSLFSHQYGRFEFRAKLPQGLGFWPALWMMGTNITSVSWPACGEIDVMESKGSWSNQVQGTLHYSDASNNHLSQTKLYTLPASGDSVTNFHIYAVEWSTNSIKWIVDSATVQTWTSWSSSTGPYPAPYNQPFFVIMNLAIGGNYVGNPTDSAINTGTSFPGEMQVDYVRVYDDVPSLPLPPTGLTSGVGTKVYLNWDASTSGATGYKVKRAIVSGGPYTLGGTAATNSFVDNSASSCSTYYYVISATNSLGESANSSEIAATILSFALAVNSGGTAANQFGADTNFSGGTQAAPVSTTVDTSGVMSPAPQAVYQTERYGNFTYTFTNLTPGWNYKVRLHFAETYWTSPGQRRFNVLINGTPVLSNFDIIAAAGGANKANIQELTATATGGGQVTIQYVTVTDNAKSCGIEILLPPPAAPVAGNNGPLFETGALNLTASTVPGNVIYHWSGPNGFSSNSQNPTIANVTTNAGGVYTVVATFVGSGCSSRPSSTTVTVQPRVPLTYHLSSNTLTLTWPTGTLQSSTNPTGPWTDTAAGISSTNIIVSLPSQFFRVKLQ